MNALLDIFVVVLFVVCVSAGYKNGFVKTIMNVVSFIVSFVMAQMFSPGLSDYLYTKYIKPTFVNKIMDDLSEIIGRGIENLNLDRILTELPKEFIKIISSYGSDIDEVQAWADHAEASGMANIGEFIANNLASPLAKNVSYLIAFAIIFFVSMILCGILTFVINGIAKLPGLDAINKLGGTLLGILYGIIWGYIFVFLISLILPYFVSRGWIDSASEVINNSMFFKWLYENPPLDMYKNIG